MRVRCRTNRSKGTRHALAIGGIYEVIGIEAGDFRIIDDLGSPVLFSPRLFSVIDRSRPTQWRTKIMDGVEYSYAPELGKPGFFEDYHEDMKKAVIAFNRYINRHLNLTTAA